MRFNMKTNVLTLCCNTKCKSVYNKWDSTPNNKILYNKDNEKREINILR